MLLPLLSAVTLSSTLPPNEPNATVETCMTSNAQERAIARSGSWIAVLQLEQECVPQAEADFDQLFSSLEELNIVGGLSDAQEKAVLRAVLRTLASAIFIERLESGELPEEVTGTALEQAAVGYGHCISFAMLRRFDAGIRGIAPILDQTLARDEQGIKQIVEEVALSCPKSKEMLRVRLVDEYSTYGFTNPDELESEVQLSLTTLAFAGAMHTWNSIFSGEELARLSQ